AFAAPSAPPAAPSAPPVAPAPGSSTRSAAPPSVVDVSDDDYGYDENPFPPMELPHEAPSAREPSVPAMAMAPSQPARGPEPVQERAPEPASAPAAPVGGDTGPIDGARLRRAWTGMLQEGDGLPPGMGFMLRAAQVAAEGRTVRLTFPPGSPALERLSQLTTRQAIEQALAKRLGGPARLDVATGAATAIDPAQGRFTAESVRRDRLKRMMEAEPVLAAAVQAWDLELVD
ncbi:MAG TPA: hypothetical protein VFS20_17670, partial [Longimicrobium sp.]|nr:hypothetical protein [Longimicrobium sp.]